MYISMRHIIKYLKWDLVGENCLIIEMENYFVSTWVGTKFWMQFDISDFYSMVQLLFRGRWEMGCV